MHVKMLCAKNLIINSLNMKTIEYTFQFTKKRIVDI